VRICEELGLATVEYTPGWELAIASKATARLKAKMIFYHNGIGATSGQPSSRACQRRPRGGVH
jgi:hypothetical protein